MKLELIGDEVQQYFDMRDDLAYYKQKAQELEDELDMLRESTVKFPLMKEYTEGMVKGLNELVTYDKSGTRWDAEELSTLAYIRNHSGLYDGKPLDFILPEFPGRSESSVKHALWTKKIGVKNGKLKFKIEKPV